MHPVPPETVVRQLAWRYATKKFDAARRIPDAEWDALERTLVLTPSSFGLQPWKFVVVTSPGVKERLVAASWNQQQILQASHVVVLAIRRSVGAAQVDEYVKSIARIRGVTLESLERYRQVMVRFLAPPGKPFDVDAWASLQVYIALGQFMASAAMMGIDTCPMEGIEPAKYDEILDLAAKGLGTVVACCAGYRAADDPYTAAKKVRYEREDVIVRV